MVAEMNEMLFECYAFPHVAYGVDGMFAYYKLMDKSIHNGFTYSATGTKFKTSSFQVVPTALSSPWEMSAHILFPS